MTFIFFESFFIRLTLDRGAITCLNPNDSASLILTFKPLTERTSPPKPTSPIKGATLIGNGPEAMKNISMIGNDLKLDDGVGTCGKDGQSVPVGVGQPTLKISGITVGGTQTH